MDLSGLKWPLIIVVVVGVGFLLSSSGTNYMFKKFTQSEAGVDAAKDKHDEAGLSKLGGFLLMTFRYQKANEVFGTAVGRYPQGANVWYNKYRMVKCAEKLKNYAGAAAILNELMNARASEVDSRVPEEANLRLRRDKLIEIHQL
ncbi:MAG TPA: hypothetical protein PLO37_24185 [Candidatus Hydrogenedentes bacterium]|nr:hypothetical protein [Candidatus Hydrogenedentota bacterium]HPG69963.1 hypothetical protein [Candidatus Hydrogenedentota bacterium]